MGIGLLITSIIEDNGTIFSRISKYQAKSTLKQEKQNINPSDNLQAYFGRLTQVCD